MTAGIHPVWLQCNPPVARRRNRILADLTVDSTHQERRETGRTVVVIAMFVIAACACAVVFYYMKDWISR